MSSSIEECQPRSSQSAALPHIECAPHSLIEWLDVEVRARLLGMNEKLDCLLMLQSNHNAKDEFENAPTCGQCTFTAVLPAIHGQQTTVSPKEFSYHKLPNSATEKAKDTMQNQLAQFLNRNELLHESWDCPQWSEPSTMASGEPHCTLESRDPPAIDVPSPTLEISAFPEIIPVSERSEEKRVHSPASSRNLSRQWTDKSDKSSASSKLKEAIQILSARSFRSWSDQIWMVLEYPESSSWAAVYGKTCPFAILVTVLVALLQAMDISSFNTLPVVIVESVIDAVFTIEILIRLLTCPNKKLLGRDPNTYIDLLASLPVLLLRSGIHSTATSEDGQKHERLQFAFFLGVVPVLRLLKVLRHFQKFHLLLEAFTIAFEALPVLLYIYAVLLMVFTVLVYIVEPPDNIPALPQALWLVIVTATTVGYGDVTPQSTGGAAIVAGLIFVSMMYVAIPVGIIGTAFSEVWSARDSILLKRQIRHRLLLWGYAPKDLRKIFNYFDKDDSGELDFDEFYFMLSEMRLGLSSDRVGVLFQLFDRDGSGTIDDEEFVQGLFPETFR